MYSIANDITSNEILLFDLSPPWLVFSSLPTEACNTHTYIAMQLEVTLYLARKFDGNMFVYNLLCTVHSKIMVG